MPHNEDKSATRICARADELKGDRSNWEHLWQLISDRVLPSRSFLQSRSPGERRRLNVWDATASTAVVSLASAVHGLLTNPAIEWFNIKLKGVEGQEEWERGVTDWALGVFGDPDTGFATASHELYLDQIAFGTGIMEVKTRFNKLRFRSYPLTDTYLYWDDDDDLVEVYRIFELTAAEIVSRWGDEASDQTVKDNDDEKKRFKKIELIHQIIRADFDEPGTGEHFISRYVEKKAKNILSEGTFSLNPFMAPRWTKSPDEMYGRGPAIDVLPAIMTANAITKDILMAAQMQTRPPMLIPANALEGDINTAPGAINYMRTGGVSQRPEPLITGSNAAIGEAVLEKQIEQIKEAFFLDIFTMPEIDRQTATEASIRQQQNLIKASPIVSRQLGEWLTDAVKRVIGWGLRTGQIPPPQISVEAQTMDEGFDRVIKMLDMDFVSPMAMAQKASKVNVFSQALIAATPILQGDPTVFQTTIPGEQAVIAIMKAMNVDPTFYRSEEEAQQIRQQMEEQSQVQQQLQAADTGASALRNAGAGIESLTNAGTA